MNYYSEQAYRLSQWSHEENNRVKASHLIQVSNRLEERYRNNHKGYDRAFPYGTRPPRIKSAVRSFGSGCVNDGPNCSRPKTRPSADAPPIVN